MLRDSLITSLDWNSLGKDRDDNQSECTFWTGQDGQMCVQYFRPESDLFYQPHTHSEYTIVVCLSGEITINQLGQQQVIGAGEALIGNHGVEHSSGYRSQNGRVCEAVSIALDPRLLAALTADFKLPAFSGGTCPAFVGKVQNSILQDCALNIAQELKCKRLGHKIVIETQAIRLLVETMRSWPREQIGQVGMDASPRLPRRDFVRAYEFMRWCRKENFRLQHLCRFLGSSEERFTRLFLASTQRTPANFYNRLLLEQARALLRNAKLSIKEIGFELGFKTSSHFVATFRRELGVSPQEYRQQSSGREHRLPLASGARVTAPDCRVNVGADVRRL